MIQYLIANIIGRKIYLDACELPKKTGICGATNPRFYFDAASGQCKEFNYSGCGGNGNNFESEYECKMTCTGNSQFKYMKEDTLNHRQISLPYKIIRHITFRFQGNSETTSNNTNDKGTR